MHWSKPSSIRDIIFWENRHFSILITCLSNFFNLKTKLKKLGMWSGLLIYKFFTWSSSIRRGPPKYWKLFNSSSYNTCFNCYVHFSFVVSNMVFLVCSRSWFWYYIQKPLQSSTSNFTRFQDFDIKEGFFYKLDKLYVPHNQQISLLKETHSTLYGGHFGKQKTLHHLYCFFYWLHMHRDVLYFLKRCAVYCFSKPTNRKMGLSITLHTPSCP